MKKLLILFALLFSLGMARAQWFDFSQNKETMGMGIHLGQVASNTDFHDFGFGFGLSIYGFYVDFMYDPPEFESDNHVINEQVPDSRSLVINLGYQIPVLPWLRLCPVLGYSEISEGYTDFSTVNIAGNENRMHIEHDFITEENHPEFNYGCGILLRPIRQIDIYGFWTKRAIYGGISFNIDSLMD